MDEQRTDPAPVGHDATRVDISERRGPAGGPGAAVAALVGSLGLVGLGIWLIAAFPTYGWVASTVLFVVAMGPWTGLTVISPGETRVVQLFGRYVGTMRGQGFGITIPLTMRHNVSVRVRNFETTELKVNDADGNPVNIAAIVVWQVADTAKATFAVEDYQNFVHVQSESALRHVAMSHPYDRPDAGTETLRGATDLVSQEIATEVAARVAVAGVEVVEARISNLAYAPEIAQAMLQRQQAGAIIAAREQIVTGAVSMVTDALSRLEEGGIVALDDERRAAMVSNLLVVLCGDSRATPVLNTGTLYS